MIRCYCSLGVDIPPDPQSKVIFKPALTYVLLSAYFALLLPPQTDDAYRRSIKPSGTITTTVEPSIAKVFACKLCQLGPSEAVMKALLTYGPAGPATLANGPTYHGWSIDRTVSAAPTIDASNDASRHGRRDGTSQSAHNGPLRLAISRSTTVGIHQTMTNDPMMDTMLCAMISRCLRPKLAQITTMTPTAIVHTTRVGRSYRSQAGPMDTAAI